MFIAPRLSWSLERTRETPISAIAQAVRRLELSTQCFAIDTWTGDEQAGFYPEVVYEEFSRYHYTQYASFFRLVRSTFDQALEHFGHGGARHETTAAFVRSYYERTKRAAFSAADQQASHLFLCRPATYTMASVVPLN